MIEIIAEETKPIMAIFIIVRVMCGKLYERIVDVKALPPTTTGNQPSKKMMMELVENE